MKSALVLLSFAFSLSAFAQPWLKPQPISFSQTWSRYPAPDAIVETLRQQFPHADATQLGAKCLAVSTDNQMLLGQSNPLTGEPAIQNPNSAFIVWYTGCLKTFMTQEQQKFSSTYNSSSVPQQRAIAQEFVGQKLIDLCALSTGVENQNAACAWPKLDQAKRIQAITEEIEMLVGPDDVIRDQGLAPSIHDLASRIDSQLVKLIQTKPTASAFLGLTLDASVGRPPTPLYIRPAIQFLILLNDTLKY